MRKTMGAEQRQLLSQFLVESLVIAAIGMVAAIAILEIVIPLFNNAADKIMTLDYMRTLPWLAMTTVLVGLCAGLYPAWLITRASPIDALRDVAERATYRRRMFDFVSQTVGGLFALNGLLETERKAREQVAHDPRGAFRTSLGGLSRYVTDSVMSIVNKVPGLGGAVAGFGASEAADQAGRSAADWLFDPVNRAAHWLYAQPFWPKNRVPRTPLDDE